MTVTARLLAYLRPHRWDSRILVLFLTVAGTLFGLIKLVSEIVEGDTFALDKAILRGLRMTGDPSIPIGPIWLRPAMIDLTALGSVAVLMLVTVLAIGYLLATRRLAAAAFATASISGGACLSALIKALLMRPRPMIVPHLVSVSSSSFPSGHSMNAAVVYLTLATLLARGESRRSVQIYLIGAAIFLALMIGVTRVYLGVHWPSDVVAGWTIGAMWAAACSLLAKHMQARYSAEPVKFKAQPNEAILFGGTTIIRCNGGRGRPPSGS